MYGTVARMKIKPGMEDQLRKFGERTQYETVPGFRFSYIYKLDSGDDEYILVAGFEDKASYVANASSPEQHKRYEEYRSLLAAEPQWSDGEIVHAMTA